MMRCELVVKTVAFLSIAATATAAEIEILPSGLEPGDVEQRRYLDYARECLELLIEHGTDRYGQSRTPVLMNVLDVRTRVSPENPLALDEAFRVIRRGRRGPAGGNLYPDQPTIRAMFMLSKITEDNRYEGFARTCLAYYVNNLVDEKGLLWWGWHRHYDAYRDEMTGHAGKPHEIHIQEPIWPMLWQVSADAVTREIEAIWEWHVVDKATGECNRHGDGQRGCDFAMSGGEILYAFAFLYSRTKDQRWLDRARLVADYYSKARHPKTNLIPNRPNAGSDRFDGSHFDNSITGFLCPRLLKAYQLTSDPVFRDQAVTYLKAYAKYGYDVHTQQFWGSLALDGTPVPGPRVAGGYGQYEPRGYIDMWEPYVAGYENPIYTAQAYAFAADLTGEEELVTAAKRWAGCIRRVFPPATCYENTWYAEYAKNRAPHGTYAGLYGRTISFFLHLERITEKAEYREFAREVACEALSRLYYKGLLRGHPSKPYYESIDGVGYLLVALLQLDDALTGAGDRRFCRDNW